MRPWFLAFLSACLAACGTGADDGIIDVAFIAEPEDLQAEGVRLSNAGQHLCAALSPGLVRIDSRGEVVPGRFCKSHSFCLLAASRRT